MLSAWHVFGCRHALRSPELRNGPYLMSSLQRQCTDAISKRVSRYKRLIDYKVVLVAFTWCTGVKSQSRCNTNCSASYCKAFCCWLCLMVIGLSAGGKLRVKVLRGFSR